MTVYIAYTQGFNEDVISFMVEIMNWYGTIYSSILPNAAETLL